MQPETKKPTSRTRPGHGKLPPPPPGFDPHDPHTWPVALTVPEAAAVLRLAITTVRLLVARGDLPACKPGRQVRISRVALLDFMGMLDN